MVNIIDTCSERLLGDSPIDGMAASAARALFDPAYEVPGERFRSFLFARFQIDGTAVDDADELSKRVLADAYASGILTRHRYGLILYDDSLLAAHDAPSDLWEYIDVTDQRIEYTIEEILSGTASEGTAVDRERSIRIRANQAIDNINYAATQGKRRKLGNEPEYFHQHRAASYAHFALGQVAKLVPSDEQKAQTAFEHFATAIEFAIGGHDVLEDWKKPHDYYGPRTDLTAYTPLLFKTLLIELGLPENYAMLTANAMRNMNHIKIFGKDERSVALSKQEDAYKRAVITALRNVISAIGKISFDMFDTRRVDPLHYPTGTDSDSASKRAKMDLQEELLMTNAPFRWLPTGNMLVGDRRGVRFGKPIHDLMAGMIVEEGDPEKYPEVDFSNAVSREEFRSDVVPKMVKQYREDNSLTTRYPDSLPIAA